MRRLYNINTWASCVYLYLYGEISLIVGLNGFVVFEVGTLEDN